MEVDAHALALGEAEPRVVPVGVDARPGGVLAGDLAEPGAVERGERQPLGAGDVGLALEDLHVPHVLVERRDVPVAHERDLGVGVGDQFGGGVVTQSGQPLELVRVVGVGEFSAVGHVEAVDADAVAHRGDRARLRVLGLLGVLVEAGHAVEAQSHVLEPDTGGHGDAVPLAQAVVGDLVAQFAEVLLGELLVLALGLLHRQDVDVGPVEPGEHAVLAGSDRVHIPGGQAHGCESIARRAAASPWEAGTGRRRRGAAANGAVRVRAWPTGRARRCCPRTRAGDTPARPGRVPSRRARR